MSALDVDAIDRVLLAALRVDGRLTYEALAARAGLSRTAARARVRSLTRSGALRVIGVVHPAVFGLHVIAHVGIDITTAAAAVAVAVTELEEAPFVSVVSGRFGVVAELRTSTTDTLDASLDRVRAVDGVRSVETATYTSIYKSPHFPTRDYHAVELDHVDRSLLARLQEDGRVPFAELAAQVQMSPGAVRTRVLRLMDHGVVRVRGMTSTRVMGLSEMCGFSVWASGALAAAIEDVAALPRVEYLAATVGRCDLVGTVVAGTLADVADVVDVIRTLPSVRRVETWTHMRLVKENYERSVLTSVPALATST